MISPYLCTDCHRDDSISSVPVYCAATRPIGEIGCDDGISSLDTVDTFTIGRSDADNPAGVRTSPPPRLRCCGLNRPPHPARCRDRVSRGAQGLEGQQTQTQGQQTVGLVQIRVGSPNPETRNPKPLTFKP